MADENMRGDRKASSRTGPRKRQKAPLYAAVDLGTNNCRLLIAARKRDGFTVIDSHSQMARLGEGLEATGRMSDASIERAMDALHKIAGKLKAKKVGHVRCIATEACRRAANGADFIKRVRDETGLTFKIIGPEEEARLALIGCHNLIAMRDHALKLVNKWKRANQIRGIFNHGKAHVIGTSGTVTCLTGVHLGLTKYRRDAVDGQWISQVDMMNTIQRLIDAGPEGRPKFPTIGEDRSALMLAGCAIVEATWSLAPGGRMRVADRGLREGLLLSMMQGPKRRKRGGKRRRAGSKGETNSPDAGKETANV